MKQAIVTTEAPAAIGPYSQAVQVGDQLYISGMLGIDPESGEIRGGMAEQAEQALKNLSAALKAADMTEANVVKTTIFLRNMAAFGTVNEIFSSVQSVCEKSFVMMYSPLSVSRTKRRQEFSPVFTSIRTVQGSPHSSHTPWYSSASPLSRWRMKPNGRSSSVLSRETPTESAHSFFFIVQKQ